jgi:hypothetical protein
LLEIHGFTLSVGRAIADEDDLANEVFLEKSEGAGGSDVAASDDGDACVVRRHRGVLSSWFSGSEIGQFEDVSYAMFGAEVRRQSRVRREALERQLLP